jgi:RNA polymerase sigma-70 factor (ECF subfamily)
MDKKLEDIFLEALEESQQKLLRICSVYAKDADDTKDLFQEVLVNIWRSMPNFKGNSSMGTWMYRITLNVCLRMRSKEIKLQKKVIRLDSITIGNLKSPHVDTEMNEQLIALRSCIRKLNEADRAAITLYLEELPYKEISNVLGLKENTVAVKVKRIKGKLLNCLKQTP